MRWMRCPQKTKKPLSLTKETKAKPLRYHSSCREFSQPLAPCITRSRDDNGPLPPGPTMLSAGVLQGDPSRLALTAFHQSGSSLERSRSVTRPFLRTRTHMYCHCSLFPWKCQRIFVFSTLFQGKRKAGEEIPPAFFGFVMPPWHREDWLPARLPDSRFPCSPAKGR